MGGLLILCTLLGSTSPDAPVVGQKLEKRIEELEVRLNRITQLYSDIYWKAIVASVDDLDLQLSAVRRKRAAIGDETRYLLNRHFSDDPDQLDVPLGKRQFLCGWNGIQTVSPLAVCDGINDCKNGYDEDFKTCLNPLWKGSQWIGHVFYNKCNKFDGIENLMVFIIDIETTHWFRPQIKLNVIFGLRTKSIHGMKVEYFEASGVYQFATRTFTVASIEMDNAQLVFTGTFYGGLINDWFIGHIVRVATGDECAELRFVREGRFWMLNEPFVAQTSTFDMPTVLEL